MNDTLKNGIICLIVCIAIVFCGTMLMEFLLLHPGHDAEPLTPGAVIYCGKYPGIIEKYRMLGTDGQMHYYFRGGSDSGRTVFLSGQLYETTPELYDKIEEGRAYDQLDFEEHSWWNPSVSTRRVINITYLNIVKIQDDCLNCCQVEP